MAAQATWDKTLIPGRRWLSLTIILLLLSLIPLTILWPTGWHGSWTRQTAAIASLGPILVTIGMWLRGFQLYRR
ncbi:MAG: hypothetical protein M5U34_16515 [Chloroflexi bacterium]|nr:hypothetical protein [Chloroflexota bacterium]